MAPLPCCECSTKCVSLTAFKHHLSKCHLFFKNNYVCKFEDCSRKYGDWNSFYKHVLGTHDVPLRTSSSGPNLHSSTNNESDSPVDPVLPSPSVCEPEEDVELFMPFVSLHDLKSKVSDAAVNLVAKFLSRPGLPRCFADVLIDDVSNFLKSFVMPLQSFLLQSVPQSSEEEINNVKQAFDIVCNPFEKLSSDYLRLQYFEKCGEYIKPQSYEISKSPGVSGASRANCMKPVEGQFIPISKVLKKFMELPEVFQSSLDYIKSVENDTILISNFVQCNVWKRKRAKFNADDIVLPLHVYYDDFEVNSALGPHAEPLGAVYIQMPFLPPECQGKVDNILLALLFNAHDRNYSNEATFRPLINELKTLESEGILINTPQGETRIFFVIGVLMGDNKGLNGMSGFVESFSAFHVCRICKIHKDDLVKTTEEVPTLLRTKENYLADVALKDPSSTGIKERCVFDEIPSFETPYDISVDAFHDTDEGVSHYVMISVLLHFHDLFPDFIDTLNNRLFSVNLGVDKDNRPPSIDIKKVREKNKLKMTGAEMFLFVRIFGTLVIDLVPKDDPYFEMYLILNDVVCISHAKVLPFDIFATLEAHTVELNSKYLALTGDTLKPKLHFLLHYSRLLRQLGPPGNLSTIRLEAKHKILKRISNTCVSRKNLSKTVAIKSQLNLCYRFICKESIFPPFISGAGRVVTLSKFKCFKSFKKSLPVELSTEQVFSPKWVEFKGTKYQQKNVIITGYGDGCPEFSEIELILPVNNAPVFVCSPLLTLGYYPEVRGYEVVRDENQSEQWFCIKQDNLIDPFPLSLFSTAKGELVLLLKTFL